MAGMATATKRKTPAKGKPPPKRAAKPAARPSRPFLRFYHSAQLRKKTLSVLDRIERAQDATAHRDDLAGVVVELTNDGLDFYFMGPLRLARAGFVLEQSANVGMKGVPGHRPHGRPATAFRVRLHPAVHALTTSGRKEKQSCRNSRFPGPWSLSAATPCWAPSR
jgi:hypothetical protein